MTEWKDVSEAPENTDMIVRAGYSLGDGEWTTDYWIDSYHLEGGSRVWFSWPQLIQLPCTPQQFILLSEAVPDYVSKREEIGPTDPNDSWRPR